MKSNDLKEGKRLLIIDETSPYYQLLEEIQKIYKNKKKSNEKSGGSSGMTKNNRLCAIFKEENNLRKNLLFSEDFFRKDRLKDEVFLSEMFKSSFFLFDAKTKSYYCSIDPKVLELFLENSSLIKFNNEYVIQSIKDLNIIQILTLEWELSKVLLDNQSSYKQTLSEKDKLIREKDEEIKELKERIKYIIEKNEKVEKTEILESQYQKINEFVYNGIKGQNNEVISKQKLKYLQSLLEEMNKYKKMLNDLIDFNKNKRISKIQSYLDKLSTEINNLSMFDTELVLEDKKSSGQIHSFQSLSNCSFQDSNNPQNSSFNYYSYLNSLTSSLNNLLTTHDIILYDEFKRLEKIHMKRNNSLENEEGLHKEEEQKYTETLTSIRKMVLRKNKIIEPDQDDKLKIVGKQFADALKYAKADKKSLREIRICAEYRDLLKNTLENFINTLGEEIKETRENESYNKNTLCCLTKRLKEFNPNGQYLNGRSSSCRKENVGGKLRSTSEAFNTSPAKGTLTLTTNNLNTINVKQENGRKQRNLAEFILKKNNDLVNIVKVNSDSK